MKAVILERYGSFDALEVREVEAPAPKANEALVRVRATSINDWDVALVAGRPVRFANGRQQGRIAVTCSAGDWEWTTA